jgi:hypothetical protein
VEKEGTKEAGCAGKKEREENDGISYRDEKEKWAFWLLIYVG